MRSTHVLVAILLSLSLFSCKKFVEDQKRQAAMSFITNGQWVVSSYLQDSTPVTDQFNGYKFKFDENGTVSGSDGAHSANGTWVAEVSDYSITSDFPGAGNPFQMLNGHWIIKDSGTTFVKADLKTNLGTMHLHLTKVP
jgi:hypothetical protein